MICRKDNNWREQKVGVVLEKVKYDGIKCYRVKIIVAVVRTAEISPLCLKHKLNS